MINDAIGVGVAGAHTAALAAAVKHAAATDASVHWGHT
jgi:hypothetical protein